MSLIDDLLLCTKAYLADLAARESAERERELPVSYAWVETLGIPFDMSVRCHEPIDHSYQVKFHGAPLRLVYNRGQLLDLMLALGIPIKSPEIPSAQS